MATKKAVAAGAQKPVSKTFITLYTLAYIGLFAALLSPVVEGIALKVAAIDPVNKTSDLSLILTVGAFLSLVANPFFGKLSDRTRSRMGMRKPWLIWGVLLSTAALFLIASAHTIWMILVGWALTQIAYNAVLAALVAVLPDQVPDHQRGRMSGLLGIGQGAGILLGLALIAASGGNSFLMFALPAVLGAVLILIFAFRLKDRKLTGPVPKYSFMEFLKSFWVNPLKAPDFGWVWIGRFVVLLGLAILTTYQTYLLTDKLHISTAQVPTYVLISTLVLMAFSIVTSIAAGFVSDKVHRRKPFVIWSSVLFTVALFFVARSTEFKTLLIALVLAGIAEGIYMSIDLALASQVLPNKKDAAKDLGVMNIANSLPQSVAPLIAPIFLAINGPHNYTSLFLAAALFTLIGAGLIQPVRKVR